MWCTVSGQSSENLICFSSMKLLYFKFLFTLRCLGTSRVLLCASLVYFSAQTPLNQCKQFKHLLYILSYNENDEYFFYFLNQGYASEGSACRCGDDSHFFLLLVQHDEYVSRSPLLKQIMTTFKSSVAVKKARLHAV